ncbi:MAG: sensor histidine kinase, partial [Myxococcales bacterium]
MGLSSAWNRLDGSLRARVFIPTAVLFAVTLAAMVAAAVEMLGRDLEKSVQQRAETFVHVAADGLTAAMAHDGPNALPDILSVVNGQRDDILSVSLLRRDGTVVSSSDLDLVGALLHDEEVMPTDHTIVQPINAEEYSVLRPIVNEAKCARCHTAVSQINGYLEARFSRRPVAAAKTQLAEKLVLA